MSILLKDNLKRLIKNPLLWIFTATQVLITIIYTYMVTHNMIHMGYVPKLEAVMFSGISYEIFPVLGLMIIFLVISFIGTDYSSGNIKNKIIAGYKKEAVYLANFVAVLVGAAIILVAKMLAFLLIAIPSIRQFDFNSSYLLAATATVALCTLFYCAFATFLVTASKNVKNALIRVVIMYILLFVIVIMIINMMPEPFAPDYVKYSVLSGRKDYSDYVLPSDAAPKQLRDLTKVIYDALPMLQSCQISLDFGFTPLCMWAILPFSLVEILAFFFGGLVIAKKQNLN